MTPSCKRWAAERACCGTARHDPQGLAREADVSERYLGQLEGGEGNMSIILLRRVAEALGSRLIDILEPEQPAASNAD